MNETPKTTIELIETLAYWGNALFEGGIIDREVCALLLAVCDRMRLLDAQLDAAREARHKENEFLSKAIETMAMRLAECNTRLSAEIHDAKLESHLLRRRLAEANKIGETPREGTA